MSSEFESDSDYLRSAINSDFDRMCYDLNDYIKTVKEVMELCDECMSVARESDELVSKGFGRSGVPNVSVDEVFRTINDLVACSPIACSYELLHLGRIFPDQVTDSTLVNYILLSNPDDKQIIDSITKSIYGDLMLTVMGNVVRKMVSGEGDEFGCTMKFEAASISGDEDLICDIRKDRSIISDGNGDVLTIEFGYDDFSSALDRINSETCRRNNFKEYTTFTSDSITVIDVLRMCSEVCGVLKDCAKHVKAEVNNLIGSTLSMGDVLTVKGDRNC